MNETNQDQGSIAKWGVLESRRDDAMGDWTESIVEICDDKEEAKKILARMEPSAYNEVISGSDELIQAKSFRVAQLAVMSATEKDASPPIYPWNTWQPDKDGVSYKEVKPERVEGAS